jgi:hypothetical protein
VRINSKTADRFFLNSTNPAKPKNPALVNLKNLDPANPKNLKNPADPKNPADRANLLCIFTVDGVHNTDFPLVMRMPQIIWIKKQTICVISEICGRIFLEFAKSIPFLKEVKFEFILLHIQTDRESSEGGVLRYHS